MTVARFVPRRRPTGAMIAFSALAALALLSIGTFRVHGDGRFYLAFVRRLLGDEQALGAAYQFGAPLWNLPFYAVGAVFDREELGFALGGVVAGALALHLVWRLLGDLDLPRTPLVVFGAFFGTPLWFYVFFEPSYTHAVDALALTAAALLLVRLLRRPRTRSIAALGGWLGFLPLVRYANVALVPLLGLPALLRADRRNRLVLAGTAAATVLLASVIVAARGLEFRRQYAAINGPAAAVELDVLAPLKMLVTLHRGLFTWTPLALLAVIGFVLLLRRRTRDHTVFRALGAGAVALLLVHVAWGDAWDAGFSYSQRFLAGLLPLYALGFAELVRRWPRAATAAGSIAAAFAVFVGLTVAYGYRGQAGRDGIDDVLRVYADGRRTPVQLVRIVGVDARERWQELLP